MAIVQVNKVTKKFGSFTALDGIDLEVNQGSVRVYRSQWGRQDHHNSDSLGHFKGNQRTATIFSRDAWHDAVEIHKRSLMFLEMSACGRT